MGNIVLLDYIQKFHEHGNARLVIGAQHGVTGTPDLAVLIDRLDAPARLYGVLVGVEADGLALHGAGDVHQHIAAVGAEFAPRFVPVYFIAPVLEILLQVIGHGFFMEGRTVDADHLHQPVQHTLFVELHE